MSKNNSGPIRSLLCGLAFFLFISLLPGSLSQTDTSESDSTVARPSQRLSDTVIAPASELDRFKRPALISEKSSFGPWAETAIKASASAPFAPVLSATKTATDVNGGNAVPGDTLMYSITITNSGAMDATNVKFTDTIDANTTLVPGSVNVSPLAGDDAYTTIGNTRLTVGFTSMGSPSVAIPGQNIFDNDMDFLGDTFTVTAFQNPSAQGGNVSINSIFGRLDYVPPVGFTGTDTISYTITDTGGKSSTATITITVNEMVWYVNNASAAGGDGRSTSPFQTLAPVNGAGGGGDADSTGHFIYVHTGSGNYTTGLELENTQKLIGEGVALVVSSLTLNPAGTKPTISNSSGNGVTLANGNTVRGLTAQTTATGGASAAIAGSSVGNLSTDTVIAVGNPGAAVDIQTAGTLAVTFESLSSTNGTRGVRLTSATGGTFTVSGTTTITGTTGDGVTITMGNPTVNFSGGVNITTMSGRGIVANAAGTLSTHSSSTVNATGGAALDLQSMNFGTGLNFTSLASTNSSAEGIKIMGSIQNITVSGTTNIQTPTGVGIDIQSIFGTSVFSLGSTTVNKTSAGTGVNLNSNGTATVGFASLALTAGNGSGLVATSAGTVNVTTGTISATNGPALLVNPTTLGMTFTSVTSTNSTGTGISLTSASGSLSIGTTTITNPSGIGISVNTSSATLNFGNTTANGSGNTGVSLTTNTGTITFGDLDIAPDGSQKGLLATDNTMTITTTTGTISTSSARAVEITRASSTTPLAVSLTSVSANGGTEGIVLTRTSGSFTITGNGNTAVGGDNSGGTLQNLSVGISLNNAMNLSLTNVRILNTSGSGINGTLVTNFTFKNGNIDNSGTGGGAETSNIAFNTTAAATENNLSGTVTITNNSLTTALFHGVDIFNFSGTISDANISGNTITSTSSTATSKGTGIRLTAFGSASTIANVTKATIANNIISGFPSANGILASGGNGNAAGPAGIFGTAGSGTDIIAITGNRLTGNPKFGAFALGAIVNGKGQGNFNISNNGTVANPITNSIGTALVVSSFGFANVTATVDNNVIVANNQAGAQGIGVGTGQTFAATDTPTMSIKVTNNNISQTDGNGILAVARDAAGDLNISIKNNTVAAPLAGNRNGIRVDAGNAISTDDDVCLDITGNTTAGTGLSPEGIGLRKQGTDTNINAFGVEGMAATSTPGVETFVGGNNPGSALNAGTGLRVLLISATSGFSNCATAPNAAQVEELSATTSSARSEVARDSDGSSKDENILHAAQGEAPEDDNVRKLSEQELSFIVQAALARWRDMRISAEEMARLEAVTFEIADLPTGQIASGNASRVRVDETAAGFGWYFDEGPQEDGEFQVRVPERELQTTDLSLAHGKMDLLTVVMHELAQVYVKGKDRLPRSVRRNLRPLMEGTLSPGVRRLPLDQWKVTPLPIGSIKPSDDKLVARSSAQTETAQTSDQPIEAVNFRGKIPAETRYAAFNPASDALLNQSINPSTINASAANSRLASRVRRVALLTPMSGETVMVPTSGPGFTLPAGKTVTIMFNVTINNPLPTGVCTVSNQGTVTADGPISIMTDGNAGMMGAQPTVTDIIVAPTISCPSNIVTNTGPGVCTASVTFSTTTIGCPVPTVTCTIPGPTTITSPHNFPKGVTTVTCTATNTAGSDTCMFTVTVNDNQAPVVTCPSPIVTSTDSNACSTVVNFTSTATDNCDGSLTPTCVPASGSTFPKGVTTVSCTATDSSSNTGNCMFTVTVNDDDAPVVTCPSPVVMNSPAGMCSVAVTFTSTATDNCDGSLTPTCVPASGSNFPKGVTTVTCSATDSSSNTGNCMFTVTINDTQAPVLNCPSPIVTGTDSNACSAVVNFTATATDNCDGSLTPVCTPASGSTFPKGVTTVSCTATDSSSNTGNCMFTVTVNDDDAPVVTCPSPIVMNSPAGMCSVAVTFTSTATDNCDGSLTPTCVPASGSTFPKGVTTVSCTATDSSSNTGNCMFTVTINDTQAPVLNCPSPITTNTTSGACSAVVNFTATATDNCDGAITPTCVPASGSTFPKGVTTVSCSATDSSSNTGNCSFTVMVDDGVAPVVTCPSPIVTGTAGGMCSAVVNFTSTATDNCDGSLTPTCVPASGSTFPKGVTTVTCSATDSSSNTGNCSFTVTVNDDDAPVVTCPSPVMTGTASNACSAVVSFTATAMDNCDGAITPVCTPASGSTFPKGVTTVSCSATDSSSNTGNCSFTVTVVDDDAPVVTCPSPIMTGTAGGMCSAVVNFTATAADNCDGTMTPVCTPPSGSTFPKGVTTVNCMATDSSSNTGMCSFTVTVVDDDPPTITCPPTQIAPPGVVNYPPPTFADNCPGAMVVCNPPSGSNFPAGFTTVTCTATDMAGNMAACSFLVSTFNVAIAGDSGGGSAFINTSTGDYQICCGGMIISGKGTVTIKGCIVALTHNGLDRRVTITYDTCKKEGKVVVQMPPGTPKCTIIDSDTRNSPLAPCTP